MPQPTRELGGGGFWKLEEGKLVRVFLNYSRNVVKSQNAEWHLFQMGWLMRILFTWFMAWTCYWMPVIVDPGEDVLRFELSSLVSNDCGTTFCDCGFSCSRREDQDDNNQKICTAAAEANRPRQPPNVLQRIVYPFFLKPMTRWDAARFLHLALRPQLRTPPRIRQVVVDNETFVSVGVPPRKQDDSSSFTLFQDSEVAHAFFPLYPRVIQFTALLLTWTFPSFLLPYNCPGLLILAAWIANPICFAIATSSLYHATLSYLKFHNHSSSSISNHHYQDDYVQQLWAFRVALLFVFNPAHVFFVTTYSESLFAAFIFTGAKFFLSSNHSTISLLAWIVCWSMATFTRSNGIIYVGFVILYALGRTLRPHQSYYQRIVVLAFYVILVIPCIVAPIFIHNRSAIQAHCSSNGMVPEPEWCNTARTSFFFYLYPYVQKKYWNVGFLRYFQWKQWSNFLLAMPILALSTSAVVSWIQNQWPRKKMTITELVPWAIQSLILSSPPTWDDKDSYPHKKEEDKKEEAADKYTKDSKERKELLFLSVSMLQHYAVLAASTILVFTMAHVQIATRLLCSTCPALYWYMAHLIQRAEEGHQFQVAEAMLRYFVLFHILGILLHTTWLPWT